MTTDVRTQFERSPATGLRLNNIAKVFGDNEVLSRIDLDVQPGKVVALLGENGAGKSTLAAIIAGVTSPTRGTMHWQGRGYAPSSPGEAIAQGIGLIQQEIRLLPHLSIAENLFIGRWPMTRGRIDRALMYQRAREQTRLLGLDIDPKTPVRRLRVAQQQLVEVAKSLMLDARLLIFDELTAALGNEETDRLFAQIVRLKEENNVSFIYVSHRLEELQRIADEIVVLRDGALIATHGSGDVPIDTLVTEMVGRDVDRLFPDKPTTTGAEKKVLEVRDLASGQNFEDISFDVRAGEIFGIAGIVGAGRTELVRAIAGVDPISSGQILIDGEPITHESPQSAIKAGLVLVPEDRKSQGLVLAHSLADNILYGNFDLIAPNGWIQYSRVREVAEHNIENMHIVGTPHQLVRRLSGGNQQKALIARWLNRDPKIVILDEPTRGIDVGSRAQIYQIIAELAQAGKAIVVVSSDLEEIIGLSHRVMVLSRGRQKAILDRRDISNEKIMNLATT